MLNPETRTLLIQYAAHYETDAFLDGDPSWFMHQVHGRENQEAMSFIAACLSYGSRQQFMKKLRTILDWTGGDVDGWIRYGRFTESFKEGDGSCFYRLFSCNTMHRFFCAYRQLLTEYGTMGEYLRHEAGDGPGAVKAISDFFAGHDISVIVPKDTRSACKRICMFLRWMVRSDSPVDLGLWSDFLDRRTLVIPLDTHVLHQALQLGLIETRSATMSTARHLTAVLAEIFPDDPLKGDFALFGLGIHGVESAFPL